MGLLKEPAHVEIDVVNGAVKLLQFCHKPPRNHVAKIREALGTAGPGTTDLSVSIVT